MGSDRYSHVVLISVVLFAIVPIVWKYTCLVNCLYFCDDHSYTASPSAIYTTQSTRLLWSASQTMFKLYLIIVVFFKTCLDGQDVRIDIV